jgi:hypothetical protein
MLSYGLGAKSKRHLQIIDEVIEEVHKKLVDEEASLRIIPLDDRALRRRDSGSGPAGGAGFRSLAGVWADMTTPLGRLMLTF